MSFYYVWDASRPLPKPEDFILTTTTTSNMEDFKIKRGDRFVCTSDVVMSGSSEINGKIAYITGKIYTSEVDGCITDEQGNVYHGWGFQRNEYFQRYEEKGEEYCGCKPYKDYFQSVQEEYGKKEDKFGGTVKIMETFSNLSNLLVYKNTLYGNSGLTPINVFSKTNAETGLLQRLDDKIARVQNSPELRKNDAADIIGYLVLLCVKKGWTNFDEFKD